MGRQHDEIGIQRLRCGNHLPRRIAAQDAGGRGERGAGRPAHKDIEVLLEVFTGAAFGQVEHDARGGRQELAGGSVTTGERGGGRHHKEQFQFRAGRPRQISGELQADFVLRLAILRHQNRAAIKLRGAAFRRPDQQHRHTAQPHHLLGNPSENPFTQLATAVGAHHDQIRREFIFVFHNATGNIGGGRLVDMRFHGDTRRKSTLANFIEIGHRLLTLPQMPLTMDGRRSIAFNDVQQRDTCAEPGREAGGGRQRGLRRHGTIEWHQNMLKHDPILRKTTNNKRWLWSAQARLRFHCAKLASRQQSGSKLPHSTQS